MINKTEKRWRNVARSFDAWRREAFKTQVEATHLLASELLSQSFPLCGTFLRIARFSNVQHLSIHISKNFGSESTRVYYIGLRGEFSEVSLRYRSLSLFVFIFYNALDVNEGRDILPNDRSVESNTS